MWYTLLVFVHVFSAVVWIGGVIGMFWVIQYTRRREGATEADRVLERVERLAQYYLVGPVLVLASGITMVAVSKAWRFSQTWVYLAIIVFIVGTVVYGTSAGPQRRIKAAREAGEVRGEEFSRLQGRYMRSAWIGTAILASIEVLMVFKPI